VAGLAGALALVAVCCCGGLTALVGVAKSQGRFEPNASWSWPAAAAPLTDPAPAAAAPASDWRDWAGKAIGKLVKAQGEGLAKGDEGAYLAVVDSTNSKLVAEHRKRFRILRAMGMGTWKQSTRSGAQDDGYRAWSMNMVMVYCVGGKDCDTVELTAETRWAYRTGKLVMVKLNESESADQGPRPWEVDDLVVKTGKRAVVATTKGNSWRLASAVKAVDRAAEVADKFAKWRPAPDKYVIYLAGPSSWKTWYGREQPGWAAAWAVPVSDNVSEVVVRTDAVPEDQFEMLMRHELTHVTSLAGASYGVRADWWLVEGIAEYAQFSDQPVSEYDALDAVASYVRGKQWEDDVRVDPPDEDANVVEAAGAYGISYLAVRRIAERFGRAKMLDFFGAVMHEGDDVVDAAPAKLGKSWSDVNGDCVRYIGSMAGA
jgi:hypothetical protein